MPIAPFKEDLKDTLRTGDIITEEKLHTLIEHSHNQVHDIQSVITPLGNKIFYRKSGPIYSFWFDHQTIESSFNWATYRFNQPMILASVLDIPELAKLDNDKYHVVQFNTSQGGVMPALIRINQTGIRLSDFQLVSTLQQKQSVPIGSILIGNFFVLINDLE